MKNDTPKYNSQEIEAKWQKVWAETGLNKTVDSPKDKFYNLVMFPYPSGDLHIGHWYNFGPADTIGRFNRMHGKDVLQPLGYDSFGLPAENAAIKKGVPAEVWTDENVSRFRKQYFRLGGMYDLDKEVDTSKPEYYRWTQWLFLRMLKAGKAYQKDGLVNWCPKDMTALANEQVIHGECERCGTKVERKKLKQWYFKITDYADALLNDMEGLDWPERVKTMQRNWIGRSEGAQVRFSLANGNNLEVYTTRPDTLYGATFLVLAPEHELVEGLIGDGQRSEVEKYVEAAGAKTDVDRLENKDKTGVFTGSYATNPVNGEKLPIWIADYVLMGYGTGAIMAVPAHDQRDYEFATKYGIEIKEVISGGNIEESAYTGDGLLVGSEILDGMNVADAKKVIIEKLESEGSGETRVQYKIRDWLISRQRYWGAPIPIIYCDACGVVPVPEDQLPVGLPLGQKFDESGQSPLVSHPDYMHVPCPTCGGDARRETDTMDTFVDSSWYFLRYPNPDYAEGPFDPEAVKKWLPVDNYMGGIEHAILHLLYARFFTKFLHGEGLIDFNEPFKKLINQGMILGSDGDKMSKRKGNVVDPLEYIDKYGADAVRLYLMFMGPYEEGGPWDPQRFEGTYRFIGKVWELYQGYEPADIRAAQEALLVRELHKTIRKVTSDLRGIKFNTAIAAMMELVKVAASVKREGSVSPVVWREFLGQFVLVLAPFTPHLAEELWQQLGQEESVHLQEWPKYDNEMIKEDEVTIVVQVNGKLRGEFMAAAGSTNESLEAAARELASDKAWYEGEPNKIIVVPNKLVNIVV
jgi:leucyl-tRNA synthetase